MEDLVFPANEDNYGGVDRFWFATEEDITGLDDLGNIQLKEGKAWNLGQGVKHSIRLTVKARIERGGVLFDILLDGEIAKYRPALETLLAEMREKRFGILVKDRNGYVLQFGRPGEWLTFKTDQKTGNLPSDRNGYRFQFEGSMKAQPISFNSIIIDNPDIPTPEPYGDPVRIYLNGLLVATIPPGGTFAITTEFTLEYAILP